MSTDGVPVGVEHFHHDGRGPELRRIRWDDYGRRLLAVDYFNPEAEYRAENLCRVGFVNSQVVMITPEEVISPEAMGDLLIRYKPAAAFDRGRDAWLDSFSPRHLANCTHYQLMFYDELLDVICEGLEFQAGSLSASS